MTEIHWLLHFFASLEQEKNLNETVVVIDDPMTSLDEHRSLTTRQEMRRLADRALQVIVLSHDKSFLCGVWEDADKVTRRAIRVARRENASTLESWDVKEDCVTEHDRRYRMVEDYFVNSNHDRERDVAAALRYILEAFIRVSYPTRFPPGSLLGKLLNRGGQEILNERDRQELREILAACRT